MHDGEKKYSPSSPSSMMSRVFQVSWLPKLKTRGTTSETNSPKTEPMIQRDARLPSMDDDDEEAYWRLSFRTDDRKIISGIPVSNSDAESQIPVQCFTSREAEEKQYKNHIMRNHEHRRSKKKQGPEDDEKLKPLEKDIFPIETEIFISRNFSLSSVDEGYSLGRASTSECQSSDKMNEETEYRMEPTYRTSKKSRERRRKRKSNSPKRELRLKVLEEMKKEKIRLKKKETKEPVAEGTTTTAYDSFAEVKTSFDPQSDFRDSMVEMICEKGIRRREELEDLLACYLTLNRDEYHDLIIKVFQQVWLELS